MPASPATSTVAPLPACVASSARSSSASSRDASDERRSRSLHAASIAPPLRTRHPKIRRPATEDKALLPDARRLLHGHDHVDTDEHEEAGDGSGRRARSRSHTVKGGGGLQLHVREWGKPDGPPILFIHGWSQNHLCWAKQYESALGDEFRLVAYDLRGHGMSEAPLEPEHYTDGKLWADDVAAIIDQLRLDRPVLVGWSYGAFVICDYVRTHGQDRIAGDRVRRRRRQAGRGGVRDADRAGLSRPLRATPRRTTCRPTSGRCAPSCGRAWRSRCRPTDFETALCWNIVVPARVRAALAAREIDDDDVLRALEVPLLVTHGRADTVVLPAMAEHVLATCPTAEASWYDGVGHVPFLEEPERFNRELAALTRRVRA